VKQVSRKEAPRIYWEARKRKLESLPKEKLIKLLVGPCPPNWGRVRNYEMEVELQEVTGEEYVISEFCPFNGRFCSWMDHAPIEFLKECLQHWKAVGDQAAIKDFEQEIERRTNK